MRLLGRRQAALDVVAVVVHDALHGVYRVRGVAAEGLGADLRSEAQRLFDLTKLKDNSGLRERRFVLRKLPSRADGAAVTGWEGREISPVLRYYKSLFWKINVTVPDGVRITEEVVAPETLDEGAVYQVTVNAYERNLRARTDCIAHYGSACAACTSAA